MVWIACALLSIAVVLAFPPRDRVDHDRAIRGLTHGHDVPRSTILGHVCHGDGSGVNLQW